MLAAFKQLLLKLQKLQQNKKDAGLFLHLDRLLWKPRCKATRNSLRRARRFEVYASEKRLATNPGRRISDTTITPAFASESYTICKTPLKDTSTVVAETKVNIQVGKVTGKRLILVVG